MKSIKLDEQLVNKIEVNKCVCCHDAPCNKMYKNINPERIIRAIKFDNKKGARSLIKDKENYLEKNSTHNGKCPLIVSIDKILTNLIEETDTIDSIEDINLNTEICGVKLENPFLLSSSTVGSRYEMWKRALELGWAGVATKTISMMSIHESSPRFSAIKDCDGDFLGFKNIEQLSEYSIDENMEMIRMLKKDFPNKVVLMYKLQLQLWNMVIE